MRWCWNRGALTVLLLLAGYLSSLEPGFAVFQYLTLRSILGSFNRTTHRSACRSVGYSLSGESSDWTVGKARWPEIAFLKTGYSDNGWCTYFGLYYDVDSFVGRSNKRICLDRFVSNARIRSDRMD